MPRNHNHHERHIAMNDAREFDQQPTTDAAATPFAQPQPPQPTTDAAPHYSTGMPPYAAPQPPQAAPFGAAAPNYPTPYASQRRTSGLAIASLVLGIVWVFWAGSLLAVIFGHIALSKTKNDPTIGGRGLAVAGLVLGYIGVATLLWVLFIGAAAAGSGA